MNLFRLVHNRKIVGYEKHEGGKIYHLRSYAYNKTPKPIWRDIMELRHNRNLEWHSPFYIPHDRKDMYTDIEVDGKKLFQRDEVEYGGRKAVIRYSNHTEGGACFYPDWDTDDEVFWKERWTCLRITGVQGVDDE